MLSWQAFFSLAVALSIVTYAHAQGFEFGSCHNYQSTNTFTEEYVQSMVAEEGGLVMVLTTGRPFSCQKLVLKKGGRFRYQTHDAFNVLRNHTGRYTTRYSSFTSPGSIRLRLLPTVFGADFLGRLHLNVLKAEPDYLLVASCVPVAPLLRSEQVVAFVPRSKFDATSSAQTLNETLTSLKVPGANEFYNVPQDCERRLNAPPSDIDIFNLLVRFGIVVNGTRPGSGSNSSPGVSPSNADTPAATTTGNVTSTGVPSSSESSAADLAATVAQALATGQLGTNASDADVAAAIAELIRVGGIDANSINPPGTATFYSALPITKSTVSDSLKFQSVVRSLAKVQPSKYNDVVHSFLYSDPVDLEHVQPINYVPQSAQPPFGQSVAFGQQLTGNFPQPSGFPLPGSNVNNVQNFKFSQLPYHSNVQPLYVDPASNGFYQQFGSSNYVPSVAFTQPADGVGQYSNVPFSGSVQQFQGQFQQPDVPEQFEQSVASGVTQVQYNESPQVQSARQAPFFYNI